jgi:hypothetical protein
LPITVTDLTIPYTEAEVAEVIIDDETTVDIMSNKDYLIHQYKEYSGSHTIARIQWKGQSSLAPSLSPVLLQVYNHTFNEWNTIDSNSVAERYVEFTLSATIDLTNYKDVNSVVSCRVYQVGLL